MKHKIIAIVLLLMTTGCATLCKPPQIVTDTVRQEGKVLHEMKTNLRIITKDELEEAISTLIESNEALQNYLEINKGETNEQSQEGN